MKNDSNNSTRDPVQDRSRRTRQAILTAGRRMVTAKGFNGTNSKDIARAAGTAVGSFYAYFTDKGELFLEIVDNLYQQIFENLKSDNEKLPNESTRLHLVQNLLKRLYDAHDIEPALHREISLILLAGTNPDHPDKRFAELCGAVRERVDQLDQEVLSWLMDMLSQSGLDLKPSAMKTSASLIFRVAEETIHRLKQFPETLDGPEETLHELANMIDLYLESKEKQ